jgi:LacI family transcriptional regulator
MIIPNREGYRIGFFNGLQDYLATRPAFRLATIWGSPFVEPQEIARLAPDGVIAMATEDSLPLLRALKVPLLNIGAIGATAGLPTVQGDNRLCGALAARRLYERGFRQFGFVTFDRPHCEERRRGFIAQLNEYKLHSALLPIETRREAWQENLQALRDWLGSLQAPVGIVAADDIAARVPMEAAALAGRAVPAEVAVIGIGGDAYEITLSTPHLSTVLFDYVAIGRTCAEVMEKMLAGHAGPASPVLVPPVGVFERDSSNIHVYADERINRALALIRKRATQGLTVDELAEVCLISRRHIDGLMREVTGRTAFGQIQWVQIEAAKHLLLSTPDPIHAIATQVGMGEERRLIRLFHRVESCTPTQWRERATRSRPGRASL